MKVFLTAALICLMSVFSAHAEEVDTTTPHKILAQSSNDILAAVSDYRLQGVTDTQALSASLLELMKPVVDFDAIAKAVMGKHYKTLNAEQQQRFTHIFQDTMIQLYAKVFMKFEIEKIEVEEPTEAVPFKGTLNMKVSAADGSVYSMNYTMRRNAEGKWLVRNVILDGINMGLAYRNQFDSSVNHYQGDVEKAIDNWAEEIMGTQKTTVAKKDS